MKFASYRDETPDGQLVLVSKDGLRAVSAVGIASSLLDALQRWPDVEQALKIRAVKLNAEEIDGIEDFDPSKCGAPLPRSPQWCDASAFLNHGKLMERAFNTPPIPEFDTVPVMYQGASDDFLGGLDEVFLPSESDSIDFEGEFGVITGLVPMACSEEEAAECIRLVVQLNDWSLRALGPREMKSGFGFLQAKPSTSFAPIAVTPDELGEDWSNGRVQLQLHVSWNGQHFGQPDGGEMNFSFGQLIAHAARTRRLSAGSIIGSGTVSNASRDAGSACIAERRVIEILEKGSASTQFMRYGDRVRMQATHRDGRPGPFGKIEQSVMPYMRVEKQEGTS